MEPTFRSGTVAILGRPNAGKSTFLNQVLGQKLAIVSPKPQTTRGKLLGVYQDETCQIAFLDTPGLHVPQHAVSVHMLEEVEEALKNAEAVLYLVDATRGVTEEDEKAALRIREFKGPKVLALNKTDQLPAEAVEPLEAKIKETFGTESVFRIQAINGLGTKEVLLGLRDHLMEGPPIYEEDTLTDKTVRELTVELIREQCFLQLQQELPYELAIEIVSFEEKEPPDPTVIQVDLFVEKDNQKGIVIGAKGNRLKAIGMAARLEIEKLTQGKVFLEMRVKVFPNWRKDPQALRRFGFGSQPHKKR